MIIIFIGEQSCGKTLSMSYYTYLSYKLGYKIFSNYNLNFKHEKITYDLIKEYVKSKKQLDKSIFAIDEIHQLIDSRSGMSEKNKILSYFCLQTAKRNVHLLGTTQFFNQIDLRLRQSTTLKIFCNRVFKTEKGFKLFEHSKRLLEKELNNKLYIQNMIMFKGYDDFGQTILKAKKKYIRANPIFKMYDTKELIDIN